MATEDRVRIYSRLGVCLCDLRVTVERNLRVSDEGEAEFDIAVTDTNCRDDYLRFGNWLMVENSKLESWVGMIDEDQTWGKRSLHVQAYTPDRQLLYRNVPRQLNFSGKAGSIFRQLINITNREEATVIEVGEIWEGGPDMPDESLSGDTLQDYLFELVQRTDGEFSFTPVSQKGRLTIYANWSRRTGHKTNLALVESYNLMDISSMLRTRGKIENELWGYGNGASTNDRATAIALDTDSRSRYGLRQGSRVYSDYSEPGAVRAAVQSELNKVREARRVFKLSALDEGQTFEHIRIGNTHPLSAWSIGWGIETRVRTTGWYRNPLRGGLDLIVEEVLDDINE